MPNAHPLATAEQRAGAILRVDLDALVANWRRVQSEISGVQATAVIKADAYGTGMVPAAKALHRAGCDTFYVATLDEAITLRAALPNGDIAVLSGFHPGTEADFAHHHLRPVLGSTENIQRWNAFCRQQGKKLAAVLHLDTGMSRLGLSPIEIDELANAPEQCDGIAFSAIISHLACAEMTDDPMNARQRDAFITARKALQNAIGTPPASLANSSGVFLGPTYHFDHVRPGACLYGVNPTPNRPNPMAQVVRLQGKILQVRSIDTPQSVGYGATHRATRTERIATVAVGYADGYLRALSNTAHAYIGDQSVAVVGRVSMDLITLDVSAVPEENLNPGALVDLIGPHYDIDALAEAGGTIGYEILTSLGKRYHRVYLGGDT